MPFSQMEVISQFPFSRLNDGAVVKSKLTLRAFGDDSDLPRTPWSATNRQITPQVYRN